MKCKLDLELILPFTDLFIFLSTFSNIESIIDCAQEDMMNNAYKNKAQVVIAGIIIYPKVLVTFKSKWR